jgi:hypothetical protein
VKIFLHRKWAIFVETVGVLRKQIKFLFTVTLDYAKCAPPACDVGIMALCHVLMPALFHLIVLHVVNVLYLQYWTMLDLSISVSNDTVYLEATLNCSQTLLLFTYNFN